VVANPAFVHERGTFPSGLEIRAVASAGVATHFCALEQILQKDAESARRHAPSQSPARAGVEGAMQRQAAWSVGLALLFAASEVLAQASPFSTGATAFQGSFLAILTPIAVIAVMGLGLAAWFNRISWGWAVAGVVGIVLVFGAPQIVAWVRGMFGV